MASGQLPIHVGDDYWGEENWVKYSKFLTELEFGIFVPALRESADFRSKGPTHDQQEKAKFRDHTTSEYDQSVREEAAQAVKVAGWKLPDSVNQDIRARVDATFETSGYRSDDSELIQRIIELDYRAYREGNPAIRNIIDKVASVASDITDEFPIKFKKIGEDERGLFPEFETPDGILPLNSLSQGTHSIMHCLLRLMLSIAAFYKFPKNIENKPGILLIDEIDAHLHPSWQRRFLPALIKHFPNMQIFGNVDFCRR